MVNREYHILLGNGPESTAVRLTAIKETDGRYLFVFRNMAFHRQIMKILEERSAQLNALLEATDGVVFTVLFENGRFGHIEQAGKPLAHKLGFSQDELVHKNFADLFDDKNRGEKFCASVLARAQEELALQGKTSFKLPVRRKDGTAFEAQTVLTALDMPGKDSALFVYLLVVCVGVGNVLYPQDSLIPPGNGRYACFKVAQFIRHRPRKLKVGTYVNG